jgi:hypothetical protein
VNGATYRQKKEDGWVVPFDPWEGKQTVARRKHTLVQEHCHVVGQSIRGRGTRQ